MAKAEETKETASKSIVDPKYRTTMNKDWMAELIAEHCVTDDGVSIEGLTKLATINGLNVDKFDAQKGSHGFAGRYRMTISNMLRSVAKKRHGLWTPKGSKSEWTEAPADWLAAKGAPEVATHDRKGNKIPTAKAENGEKKAA